MGREEPAQLLEIEGREIRVTHPDKIYFRPVVGPDGRAHDAVTKLELVRYYQAVSAGALRGIRGRPIVLKRYVNGAAGEAFYQKRAPSNKPEWMRSVVLSFPSGRTAEELVIDDVAGLLWIANLGCIDLHPHAVRAEDLAHPDELRVDLDPGPGVAWDDVRRVAAVVREVLAELGLVGFPKTSGSRGMHVLARIAPRWRFEEVRGAALALAREVERRAPTLCTSKWWKEERHGVFLDYNQNAKDKTTCSAYSVRPLPDARVSAPLSWDEVAACQPEDFTIRTMPARFASRGDPHATIDDAAGSLEALLELAARDAATGAADAPWPPRSPRGLAKPPHPDDPKSEGEAPRVAPSRAKKPTPPKRVPMPVIVIAKARFKEDALAGLERWKARWPAAAARLAVDDVLVDTMRGRSSTWTRVRVNLRHVPEGERPPEETPDPNEELDPRALWHAKQRDDGEL